MVQGPSTTDRLDGVNEGIGKKAPVKVATTTILTLSAEQTIDGIACVDGDRVLVKDQGSSLNNGIYVVSSGVWERALDCNGNRDIVKGTWVFVNQGSTNGATIWYCTSTNPVTIDSSAITWSQWSGGGGFPNEPYVVIGNNSDVTLPNNRQLAAGSGITLTDGGAASTATLAVSTNQRTSTIIYIINGGGSTITTGIKDAIQIDFACTIQDWSLFADQSGSIVVDIWKDTYLNFPPLVGDTITGSAKPTITAAQANNSSTLTGWTTAIAAGDTLRFNVDSVSSITAVTLKLKVLKS